MRNLTIKRTKSFVACLIKLKVYIEDPSSNEMKINNISCRKLGDLKNGEEKTFLIGDNAAKVFVIADSLSKGFCNEYYSLPEGQEDVFLSGKNKLNPATGNAFHFDHNDSEDVIVARKHNTRKGLLILVGAIIIGFIVGFSSSGGWSLIKGAEPKDFSSNGMTITLTDRFKEISYESFTAVYDSNNVGVFVLKEPFSLAVGFESYSLEAYIDLVIQANSLTSAKKQTADGFSFFEYDAQPPNSNEVYHYRSYAYKTNDAFWLIQFATTSKNAEKLAPQITEWAKSVRFSD